MIYHASTFQGEYFFFDSKPSPGEFSVLEGAEVDVA